MPYSYGSFYLPSGQTVFEVAPDTFRVHLLSKSDLGQYELFWQSALAVAWEHPLTFTTGVIRKFVYFRSFGPQSGILYPVIFFYLYLVYYLMIATLAVLGAVRLLRDWFLDRSDISALFLIFAVFLSVSVAHSVFYFGLRHRWMIEPLILVFSSVCLSSLLSRLERLGNAE